MGNIISWITDHWALIAGTIVVIVNEIFAWNPNLKQNSILQFLLRLKPPVAPPSVEQK